MGQLRGALWDLDGTKFRYAPHTRDALVTATAKAAHDLLHQYHPHQTHPSLDELKEIGLRSFYDHGTGTGFLRQYGIPEHISHALYHAYCPDDIVIADPQLRVSFAPVASAISHAIYTHAHGSWARRVLEIQGLSEFYPDTHIVSLEKIAFARKDHVPDGFQHCASLLQCAFHEIAMIEDTPNCLRIPKELGMTTILITDKPDNQPTHIDHCVPDAASACNLLLRLRQ